MLTRAVRSWNRFWFAPAPPTNLAIARVIFFGGLTLFYLPYDFTGWADVTASLWQPIWLFERLHVPVLSPAALAAAQADPPEMVVLDLGMPGMDGFEVARRLRALPGTKGTLLVAMTGWAREDDRRRCYEAGFDGHLPKPVEWEALRQFLAHPKLVRRPASGS